MKKLKQKFTFPNLKELGVTFLSNPILVTLFVFALAAIIIIPITLTQYGYTNEFLKNVLVEAHGMLFDILIIGTLIFALHKIGEKQFEKRLNIQRWLEEIDDFRGWNESEATFRITSNIRRLKKAGVKVFNLTNCYLANADLTGIDLQNANLCGADFTGAKLAGAKFTNAILTKSIFRFANLKGADLVKANLSGADFTGANLVNAFMFDAKLCEVTGRWQEELDGTKLNNADLFLTSMKGADLSGADLRGAKNLMVDQLGRTKSLCNAKIDPELEKHIKRKYPHLLGI